MLCAARRFLRNRRAAAALESAIGAVVLVTTSALAFNLYEQATAQPAGLNAAVTVADYVSREKNPVASQIEALATFLHSEFFSQADTVFIALAVQGAAAPKKPTTLWSKKTFVGPNAKTDKDLATCSQVAGAKKKKKKKRTATPPDALKLEAGEIVIVAEVCVKQADGVTYYHHILPSRSENAPVLQQS